MNCKLALNGLNVFSLVLTGYSFPSFKGTIIDRIDYNIENTNIKVHDGLEQIKKAAMYQKNDRKMYCIVILAVIVMLELVIVVFKNR